jgi:hypothetical protein
VHVIENVLPVPIGRELIRDAMASHKWESSKRDPSLKDNKATTNWMDKKDGGFDKCAPSNISTRVRPMP